mgnify:CR=1 FL=1
MWKIKKSKIHGNGIVATENIVKNTKIIQYVGEKISKKEGDNRSADRIKKYLGKKNYFILMDKLFSVKEQTYPIGKEIYMPLLSKYLI